MIKVYKKIIILNLKFKNNYKFFYKRKFLIINFPLEIKKIKTIRIVFCLA